MAIYGDGKHDNGTITSFVPKRRPRKSFKCIVYTCDRWKSHDSKSVYGIFTNRTKLNKELREMIKHDVIEIDSGSETAVETLSKLSISELNNHITYLYIEEFNNFNEKM